MGELKSCPSCFSDELKDAYVYIECKKCGTRGPAMNGGKHDNHADYINHESAIKAWNNLPRNMLNLKEPPPPVMAPPLIFNPDLSQLKKICKGHIDSVIDGSYHDDNDDWYYVFTAALEAFYGEDIQSWINEHT